MLTTPVQPLARWQLRVFVALAILVAATRWYAMSRSWWDWDEMLFQSAMVDYNVNEHHPHPPGFPLYIGAAKALRPLVSSDFVALRGVNLLFASLLFPAMFLLCRELRMRFAASLIAALLLTFTPTVWLYGGTAFSDVSSLALVVGAVALLLRGCRSRAAYVWGAVALAVSISFRPQNLLIGLVPGLIATDFRARDRRRDVATAAFLGIAVVAASFGFAVRASGSWPEFLNTLRLHQEYIASIDSFRSPVRPALLKLFDDFFITQYRAGLANYFLTLFAAVSLIHCFVKSDRRIQLVLASFGPFAILAWLMLDHLSVTRFAIGYAPLFAILAADGIAVIAEWTSFEPGRREPLILAAGCLTAAGMFVHGLPAIREVRSTLSPPAAAIAWIRSHLDPRTTKIYAATGMLPYTKYALRDYQVNEVADERAIPIAEGDEQRARYLIIEGAGGGLGNDFIRPRGRTWDLVRHRYFEITVVPLSSAARFREGWYEAENDGPAVWRWMGHRSVTELPPLHGVATLRLELGVPIDSLHASPLVTVTLNGARIDAFRPASLSVERTYSVMPLPDHANTLIIETSLVVNPKKEGLGDDPRDLGLQLQRISWGR